MAPLLVSNSSNFHYENKLYNLTLKFSMGVDLFMQVIEDVLKHGVEGDEDAFYSWCKMFFALSNVKMLNKFSQFESSFVSAFSQNKEIYKKDCESLDLESVSKYLQEQVSQKRVKLRTDHDKKKFMLSDLSSASFGGKNRQETIFVSNILDHQVVYFFRSKVRNWLQLEKISDSDSMKICIVVTEAIENAMKYSNQFPIVIEHSLKNGMYELTVYNSVKKTNKELLDDVFTKGVSLMRGILIMMKTLDEFDIDRDEKKNLVILKGKISVQ